MRFRRQNEPVHRGSRCYSGTCNGQVTACGCEEAKPTALELRQDQCICSECDTVRAAPRDA